MMDLMVASMVALMVDLLVHLMLDLMVHLVLHLMVQRTPTDRECIVEHMYDVAKNLNV